MKTLHHTQQTSLWAFQSLKDLSARQHQVYGVIERAGAITNIDIAATLQLPVNQVTPRTNEMVAKSLVVESHRAPSSITGRISIHWKVA